jgi:hypothetical protein
MTEQRSATELAADAGIQVFLDTYATALSAGDVAVIGQLWGYPALVVADEGVRLVSTADEVATFFAAAKEQYAAKGIVGTKAEIQRLQWLTERLVAVDVRWPQLDATGATRAAEQSTYTLRRKDDGGFELRVAVTRGVVTRGI